MIIHCSLDYQRTLCHQTSPSSLQIRWRQPALLGGGVVGAWPRLQIIRSSTIRSTLILSLLIFILYVRPCIESNIFSTKFNCMIKHHNNLSSSRLVRSEMFNVCFIYFYIQFSLKYFYILTPPLSLSLSWNDNLFLSD